jgi:hypothetical protein
MRIEMPTYHWTVRFRAGCVKGVCTGTEETEEDVDIKEMRRDLVRFIRGKYKGIRVKKIKASIRRAKEHNTKGEQKP